MKTKVRIALILATVLVMVLAFMGGSLVSAQISSALADLETRVTNAQWSALSSTMSLLLFDGFSQKMIYLPLIMK